MAITHVGNATPASVIDGLTPTIDLTTIAGLAQNDIVVVGFAGSSGTAADPAGGWTRIFLGSTNFRLAVAYKFMGASPDTSVSGWDTGTNLNTGGGVAVAFRGVDLTTPLDGVTPTNANNSSGSPDAPAIVPASNDCAVVVVDAAATRDTVITGISNYTQFGLVNADDTNDTFLFGAYRLLTGGAGVSEDPGTISGYGASTLWNAATCVLRPAAAGGAVGPRLIGGRLVNNSILLGRLTG